MKIVKKPSVKIVDYAVSESENHIITMILQYPRFIHAEVLRHSVFSSNVASSRAIPSSYEIPVYIPSNMGSNNAGMTSDTPLSKEKDEKAQKIFEEFYEHAFKVKEKLTDKDDINLHKQWANRITENSTEIMHLITVTDLDGFFHQRLDKHTQPEFRQFAQKMRDLIIDTKPRLLADTEFYLPFIDGNSIDGYSIDGNKLTLDEAILINISLAAQQSYRNSDPSLEKAKSLFKLLFGGNVKHYSPSEHFAIPMSVEDWNLRDKLFYENVDAMLAVLLKDAKDPKATIKYVMSSMSYMYKDRNFTGFYSGRSHVEAMIEDI